MVGSVQELKTRAEILHKRAVAGDLDERRRLRKLTELASADDDELAAAVLRLRRKHYLLTIAREHGFTSWEHARRVLEGDPAETDFGTLLYGKRAFGTLNVWFAQYDEARNHLDTLKARGERHYLLAYRRQFFIVDRFFIDALGLDPDDADWEAIDWDWARPREVSARERLYQKYFAAMRCQQDEPAG